MEEDKLKKLSDIIRELEEDPLMQKLNDEWCKRMNTPLEIDGLKLVCTCGACPEQYDVFDAQGKQVGYLRLRHGHFRADYPDCGGETVYESDTKGDGVFDDEERMVEIKKAIAAIKAKMES